MDDNIEWMCHDMIRAAGQRDFRSIRLYFQDRGDVLRVDANSDSAVPILGCKTCKHKICPNCWRLQHASLTLKAYGRKATGLASFFDGEYFFDGLNPRRSTLQALVPSSFLRTLCLSARLEMLNKNVVVLNV